ncbi:MAG: hypothetical protein IPK16_06945 [Anaerolineales bacterium]|nr:hypothetical protein [Anaerolineales bacterium]
MRTKLYKPRPRLQLTPRPELLQKLNARIDSDLTLIVAPVGFGKTTTVAAWCAQAPLPVAWLTLDENDNEPARFLTYVIAAIRTLAPEACPETSGVLRAGHALEVAALTTLLANEIDDLPERFALVLDDYHCITAPVVHQLVDGLLRHPPLQLHLLIAGRTDPPLAIARLRANGRLNELRAGEFRFTRAEAEHFLAGALTANADVRTTDLLIHSLDGWVAGLQLAALSLNTSPDQQMALRDLEKGRDRYIMEYLFEQVLQHQPPEVETFLLRTSILDRISPDLARAVVAVDLDGAEAAPTGAAVAVSLLAGTAGLFTHALDSAGEWYSYHALFRELLRHRLRVRVTPGQIAALYQCACQWHRQHGQIDESVALCLCRRRP